MFLRETRRTNADGSVVSYLQLAHNQRHPVSGNPVAKVIHNFGRADKVDRTALARLVSSISRFLTPEQAVAAAATAGGEVEVLDSRRLGGAWTLDRMWERLGIGAALRQVATGRRYDGVAVERVLFALVAQRALEPGSKLAATRASAAGKAAARRPRSWSSRSGRPGSPSGRASTDGTRPPKSACSSCTPANGWGRSSGTARRSCAWTSERDQIPAR